MKYLIFSVLLFATILSAQTQNIKGVVTDQDNNPLYLANVVLLNSNIGVTTNENGGFNLIAEFDSGDKIIISYVGYKSTTLEIANLNLNKQNLVMLEKIPFTSQTVLVQGSIGEEGVTPMAFAKVTQKDIKESYVHQDVPEYLSYLPSTTFYSESGNGIGYNYLSIRGFDQRRIAISVNGIPQNDPEDNNVYWHNMNDILSSIGVIQVQRGAGSGVIGYPAVGGSINIITSNFSDKPRFTIGADAGSFNTRKYSASFGSGLIDDKYSVYVNLSKTMSDGYRDLSWVDFNSFYVSAVRYDKKITTQFNIYGGPVSDGLVYNGLPKGVIKNRELRKANYSYWDWDKENGKFQPWSTIRRATEIENFSQPHFELLNEFKISKNVTLNSALFLVIGEGFFDYDGSWAIPAYGYNDYFRLLENGYDTTNVSNALIRATVENKQWGWIPRLSLKHSNGSLIVGAEFRIHRSNHFGNINFAENIPNGVPADYEYYYYNGAKDIINLFANEQYQITDKLNVLGELQLAYHKYRIYNEKYVGNDFSVNGLFLNPRFGLNYKFTQDLSSYFSFARVTREPRLKNYYDAAESSGGEVPQFEVHANGNYDFSKPLVNPETMNSFELGTSYNTRKVSISANLFYMMFNDEIVKSGQLDRFGQAITGNMDKTTHAGIELSGTLKLNKYLDVTVNGTYSKNRIAEGFYYKNDSTKFDLKNNNISGFPDITANGIIRFNYNGFFTQVWIKYVGEFYTDNFGKISGIIDYDNILDKYFVSNILVSYQFNANPIFNNVKVFCQVNNVFDNLYAAYGSGKEFFPAAERNITAGVKVEL